LNPTKNARAELGMSVATATSIEAISWLWRVMAGVAGSRPPAPVASIHTFSNSEEEQSMATKKKAAKKKKARTAGATAISATSVRALRQTVKLDALSKSVAASVNRAVAGGRFPGGIIRGPIICGIIWRPDTGTFQPIFETRIQ